MNLYVNALVRSTTSKYEVTNDELKFSYSGVDLEDSEYSEESKDIEDPLDYVDSPPNLSRSPSFEQIETIKYIRKNSVRRRITQAAISVEQTESNEELIHF